MSEVKTVALNSLELDVDRIPCEGVYKAETNTKAQRFKLCITELSPPARTAYLKHISPEKRLPEKIISLQKQCTKTPFTGNNVPFEKLPEKLISPRTLSLQRAVSLSGLLEEKPVSPKPSLSEEDISQEENSVESLISHRIRVIKSFLQQKELSHGKIISPPEHVQKPSEIRSISPKDFLRISPKDLLPNKPTSPKGDHPCHIEQYGGPEVEHDKVIPNRHITAIKVKIKRKPIPPKTVSLQKVDTSQADTQTLSEKLISLWQSEEDKAFSPEKTFSPNQEKLVPESSVALKVLPPEKSGVIYKYKTIVMDNSNQYQSFMRVKRERPKSSIPKPWVQKTRKRPLTAIR